MTEKYLHKKVKQQRLVLAVLGMVILASPMTILPLPTPILPSASATVYQLYSVGSADSIDLDEENGLDEEQQGSEQEQQGSQTSESNADQSEEQGSDTSQNAQDDQETQESGSATSQEEEQVSADQQGEQSNTSDQTGQGSETESDVPEQTGNQSEEDTEQNQTGNEQQTEDAGEEQGSGTDSDPQQAEEEDEGATSVQEQESEDQNTETQNTQDSSGSASSESEQDTGSDEQAEDTQQSQQDQDEDGAEQAEEQNESTGEQGDDSEAQDTAQEQDANEAESGSETDVQDQDEATGQSDTQTEPETTETEEGQQSGDTESEQEETAVEEETGTDDTQATASQDDDQSQEAETEGAQNEQEDQTGDQNNTEQKGDDADEQSDNAGDVNAQQAQEDPQSDAQTPQEQAQEAEKTDDANTKQQQPEKETEPEQQAPEPVIGISPTSAKAGTKVLVSGKNFDDTVNFALDNKPIEVARMGKANDGSFKAEVTIPSNVSRGMHVVKVSDNKGNEVKKEFKVISPTLKMMSMTGEETKWVMLEGFDFTPMAGLAAFFDEKKLNGFGMTDFEGKFMMMMDVHKPKSGFHTVKVMDNKGNEAVEKFKIEPTTAPIVPASKSKSESKAEITLTPKSGAVGKEITMIGNGLVGKIKATMDGKALAIDEKMKIGSTMMMKFNVPKLESGVHKVKVSDTMNNIAVAEFNIIESDITGFSNTSNRVIDVSTDKSTYTLGDTVKLSGKVSPINVKEQVVIQVFNPSNDAYRFAQVSIDKDGSYSYDFPITGKLAVDGIYSVRVTYIGVRETTTFKVDAVNTVGASIERVALSVLEVLDQTGKPITAASIGEQVTLQSEITNAQNIIQPFTSIVQIKDSNDSTVKISWVSGELKANQSMPVGQSWVPDSAGDFTVEVFVWESIDTPVPLAPVQTTSLNVL